MVGVTAVAVIANSSNGDDGAVAWERDIDAEAIILTFAINIATELVPGAAIPLVDAGVAGICAIPVI